MAGLLDVSPWVVARGVTPPGAAGTVRWWPAEPASALACASLVVAVLGTVAASLPDRGLARVLEAYANAHAAMAASRYVSQVAGGFARVRSC
jgi:hypothetical protein